jgi:hypothetical protein
MKLVLRITIGLLAVYLLLLGAFFFSMYLPPVQFAGMYASIPGFAKPAFGTFFERFWAVAGDGSLAVGDSAPDFELDTYDHKTKVRLSSFHGLRPVVLVFGSYT